MVSVGVNEVSISRPQYLSIKNFSPDSLVESTWSVILRSGSFSILRWLSLALIFTAVILTGFQLVRYSRIRNTFPPGMVIAGVPVGGLTQQQAADRLVMAYGVPVELHYNEAVIQIKPSVVGFELDLQGMLTAADAQRINQPFWPAFWDYLWDQLPRPNEVPLSARVSEERLRSFLKDEIAIRYDRPPVAAMPVPGSTNFSAGDPGTLLDVDRAVILIQDALRSHQTRTVNLTFSRITPPKPSFRNLSLLLQQTIDLSGFDGIIEVYVLDLQTNQEIHFAYQNGEELRPDIAFTAASTMKVPIMISTFRRVEGPLPPQIKTLLEQMIERSENDPADRLMEQMMDRRLGPLDVTADLKEMGLSNTFLAGYFYPGAPLLQAIVTPANQRTDISTKPDRYNQTTVVEMSLLLEDLYHCATNGGGTLIAVFPGQITQDECRQMINLLTLNDIPLLLQGGLPEGTRIAHKHGWIQESDGYQHMMGNSGIIFTPGGNYIMSVFMYHPVQLVFDPANRLVMNLSRAAFNYFNLDE
jgi:beta-lactamase class A